MILSQNHVTAPRRLRGFLFALLLVGSLSAASLGERVLLLQAEALPDSLRFPPGRYAALTDSVWAQMRQRVAQDDSPETRLRAFCAVCRPLFASATSTDILACDLAKNSLDCTSLAILMYDVWMKDDCELMFVAQPRHMFLTDGIYDYDPLHESCVPSIDRDPASMEVTGGEELLLSLSERAVGEWLGAERFDEASAWFRRALQHQPQDPLIRQVWGVMAIEAGDDALAESLLRQQLEDWPDAARSQYALGKLLCEKGDLREGRERLKLAYRLAGEQDERWVDTIRRTLEGYED